MNGEVRTCGSMGTDDVLTVPAARSHIPTVLYCGALLVWLLQEKPLGCRRLCPVLQAQTSFPIFSADLGWNETRRTAAPRGNILIFATTTGLVQRFFSKCQAFPIMSNSHVWGCVSINGL